MILMAVVTKRIFFLQNLSERFPRNAPARNIPREYIDCAHIVQDSVCQKCAVISGRTGINSEKPSKSKNAVVRIRGRSDFAFIERDKKNIKRAL